MSPSDRPTVTPERVFGPCRKCGSVVVAVRFHGGEPHCSNCRRDRIDAPSCRYTECGREKTYKPHLSITCERCRARWIEEPSDDR